MSGEDDPGPETAVGAVTTGGLTKSQRYRLRLGDRWRQINRERLRRWRRANPEKEAAIHGRSYAKHLVQRRLAKRLYMRKRRALLQRTPAWREMERVKAENRRALIGGDVVTAEEWNLILDRFGHRCAYCTDGGVRLEMDHLVPLTKGGRHVPKNIVPACKPCNSSKGNRAAPRRIECG